MLLFLNVLMQTGRCKCLLFEKRALYLVLVLPFDLLGASAADQIGFPVSASSYSSLKSLCFETRSSKHKLCYSALNNM